jgi:hypothetical protein
VIPPYESAVAPVTIPALAGAVLVAIAAGFFLTVAGLVVGAGSLVAASAAPAEWSASSCAAWRCCRWPPGGDPPLPAVRP